MDDRTFWRLIDESREQSGGHADEQIDALRGLLAGHTRRDIEQFAKMYRTLHADAYHWDCWGAGYLLAGGMSDDAFSDFRDWLISRGETLYQLAIEDPDALADAVPEDAYDLSAEGLGSVPRRAYEDAFNERLPRLRGIPARDKPEGALWSEDGDDLSIRFPRLWARASG
jgi:hypothetical protein